MNSRNAQKGIFALLCIAGLLVSSAASASAVKPVMKDMRNHYNAAMASQTLPEFQRYETAFQNDVVRASTMNYSADPATYQQGMKELQLRLGTVRQAMAANNLPEAKQAMSQLLPVKKHYHNLLN